MDNDGMTLASEILKEVKASARRWFIAFCVMTALEVFTIAGFLVYISLPVEELVTVENDDGMASYIGNDGEVRGVIYNGKSDSEEETESET